MLISCNFCSSGYLFALINDVTSHWNTCDMWISLTDSINGCKGSSCVWRQSSWEEQVKRLPGQKKTSLNYPEVLIVNTYLMIDLKTSLRSFLVKRNKKTLPYTREYQSNLASSHLKKTGTVWLPCQPCSLAGLLGKQLCPFPLRHVQYGMGGFAMVLVCFYDLWPVRVNPFFLLHLPWSEACQSDPTRQPMDWLFQ